MMLETRILPARDAADGAPVLVLLHGRGADASDLEPLARFLPDRLALVLPRAPFAAAPWGYGPGWAWYRYLGEDRPEPESFRAAQLELDDLIERLAAGRGPGKGDPGGRVPGLGFRPGPVLIGGFSQGGTMSIARALRRPGGVAGVVNFSGFVPSHPDVEVTPATVAGTPFFWGHGTHDPAIPFVMAERGRAALRSAGADLEARDYAIGHGIAPEELHDAVAWMEKVLAGG